MSLDKILVNILNTNLRSEISLEEIDPPKNISDKSKAFAAEVNTPSSDEPLAYGKLIFLEDKKNNKNWGSDIRIIGFLDSKIDDELAKDSLMSKVAWSWIVEALKGSNINFSSLRGTVSSTNSESFEDEISKSTHNQLEIRVSWSPVNDDLENHLIAFSNILSSISGLPPKGVSTIN